MTTVTIEKAEAIEGWMTKPELVWLAQQAQTHKMIVEVGSYLGQTTRVFADNTEGKVVAIDDWKGPRDVYLERKERETIFERFQKNMDGLQGKVLVVTADHAAIPPLDEAPDMVFVDGSHLQKDVERDILWALKVSQPGALICGHDYWDGQVYAAVYQTLPKAMPVPDTKIWFTNKSDKPYGAVTGS